MNDLRKKDGHKTDGAEPGGAKQHEASRVYHKKLEAYLLLLYQAYLKKETLLEPEIKAAIWRRVQFQEGFPVKIRLLQLEILGHETDNFDSPWDEVKDSLFPVKDFELLGSPTDERESQIREYKKTISDLLTPPIK